MARKGKSRRPRRKPKARKNRLQVGIPQSQLVKLRYNEAISITIPAAGACEAYVFSLNGMFDPNITGTGHQPRGFDNFMAMYDKYLVAGCKCSLRAINTSATTQNRVGMSIRTHYTPETAGRAYVENGHTKYKWLAPYVGGSNMATLASTWSAKKWFRKKNITDEYDLTGSSSSNPTSQVYLHIWADDGGFSTQTGTIKFILDIDYVVLFREPINVSES